MFKRYKNLKEFNVYYNKYKKELRLLLFCMIIASSLGMILTYLMSQRLINLTELNVKLVITFSILTMSTIALHHIGWFYWEKLVSKINNSVCLDIKKDLYNSMLNTKYQEIKYLTSGYYIERLNDDVIEVSSFRTILMGTSIDALTNISFLIIIFILNYQSGVIIVIGVIFICLIDFIRIKKDLKYVELLKELNEKYNSKINESFKGIKDIKCLGIKNQMLSNINSIGEQISFCEKQKATTYAFYSRIKTFLQYLLESILIIVAIFYLIPNGNLTVVIVLVILNYIGFMFELIEYFTNLKNHFVNGNYKAERLLEILSASQVDNTNKNAKLNKANRLVIKDLSYSYDDEPEKLILKNINLELKSRSLTLLIGKSGSGKSTLFSLLTKLNKIEDNKIFINDNCINQFNEEQFRNYVSVVNQETFLLNDTIYNNVKIVKNNASDKEIYDACKKANIYDDIIKMPFKFDTVVNETGSNLSGGQKQRIAIARVILKDTSIVLFDEPTSALDNNNHELLLRTINDLKKDKIIIIIAHNLLEEDYFDNIYYIEGGKLYKK